jgi:hypothetical protein
MKLEVQGLARHMATRVPILSIVQMRIGSNRLAIVSRWTANRVARVCPLVVKEPAFASPRFTLSTIWHKRLDNHPAQRWRRRNDLSFHSGLTRHISSDGCADPRQWAAQEQLLVKHATYNGPRLRVSSQGR